MTGKSIVKGWLRNTLPKAGNAVIAFPRAMEFSFMTRFLSHDINVRLVLAVSNFSALGICVGRHPNKSIGKETAALSARDGLQAFPCADLRARTACRSARISGAKGGLRGLTQVSYSGTAYGFIWCHCFCLIFKPASLGGLNQDNDLKSSERRRVGLKCCECVLTLLSINR